MTIPCQAGDQRCGVADQNVQQNHEGRFFSVPGLRIPRFSGPPGSYDICPVCDWEMIRPIAHPCCEVVRIVRVWPSTDSHPEENTGSPFESMAASNVRKAGDA